MARRALTAILLTPETVNVEKFVGLISDDRIRDTIPAATEMPLTAISRDHSITTEFLGGTRKALRHILKRETVPIGTNGTLDVFDRTARAVTTDFTGDGGGGIARTRAPLWTHNTGACPERWVERTWGTSNCATRSSK